MATDYDALAVSLGGKSTSVDAYDGLANSLGGQEVKEAPGMGASLARGVGLGTRAVAGGVMNTLALPADIGIQAFNVLKALTNSVAGTKFEHTPLISEQNEKGMTALGLPEPETGGERVASGALSAATSAGGQARAMTKLAETAAPGVEKMVLDALGKGAGMQTLAGGTGGASSAIAGELGANPLVQALAGFGGAMAGPLAAAGAAGITRAILRGKGQTAADAYNANIQTAKDAGIETPTVGMGGNRTSQAIESTLAKAPGGSNRMAETGKSVALDMGDRVQQIANDLARNGDPASAGRIIEKGLNNFVDRFKGEQKFLYDKLDAYLPKDTKIDVSNAMQVLSQADKDIPGAPAMSQLFKNETIAAYHRAAISDTATPADIAAQLTQAKSQLDNLIAGRNDATNLAGQFQGYANDMTQAADSAYPVPGMPRVPGRISPFPDRAAEANTAAGETYARARSASPEIETLTKRVDALQDALDAAQGKLPYEAVKKLRTLVGERLTDLSLSDNVPRSSWKAVYGALSQDMEAAAAQAGPDAQKALARANWFTKAGMERIDGILDRVSSKATPEQTYQSTVGPNLVRQGATVPNAVLRSLLPEERQQVSAVFTRDLGTANPSKQNNLGNVFSPETFLTDWSNVSEPAKRMLFADPAARKGLEDLAAAASRLREGSSVLYNNSGTTQSLQHGMVGGSLAAAVITGNVPVATGILGAMTAANVGARLMTNPRFVAWVGKTTQLSPGALPGALAQLASETRGDQDVQRFIAAMQR